MNGEEQQAPAFQKLPREKHEPALLYQFYLEAGGNIREAMRLAEEAGEDRVPAKPHTWADYAERHDFPKHLELDIARQYEDYRKKREENQQLVFDRLGEAFELISDRFLKSLKADLKLMETREHNDKQRIAAETRLLRYMGSYEAIDRLFRTYLRTRNVPEKLTQQMVEHSGMITTAGYDDLEKPKAKSPEEARELAEQDS